MTHHRPAKPYLIGEATKSGRGRAAIRGNMGTAELTGLSPSWRNNIHTGISVDEIVQQSTSLGSWFIHQRQANGLPAMSPQKSMELSENQSGFTGLGGQTGISKKGSINRLCSMAAREEILTVCCVCPPLSCLNPYSARLPCGAPSSARPTSI